MLAARTLCMHHLSVRFATIEDAGLIAEIEGQLCSWMASFGTAGFTIWQLQVPRPKPDCRYPLIKYCGPSLAITSIELPLALVTGFCRSPVQLTTSTLPAAEGIFTDMRSR